MRLPISRLELYSRILALLLNVVAIAVLLAGWLQARNNSAQLQLLSDSLALVSYFQYLHVDAETAHRGFLITHNPRFLEPYVAAEPKLPALRERIAKIPNLLEGSQSLVDKLLLASGRKTALIRQSLLDHDAGRRDAAVLPISNGRAKATMDEIRALSTEIHSLLLADARRLADHAEALSVRSLAVGAAAGFLAILGQIAAMFHFRKFQRSIQSLFNKLSHAESRQRRLSQHLLEVRESESRLLARRVHDDLGQNLTALRFDLNALARLLPESQLQPEASSCLRSAIERTAAIHEQVRTIARELRPAVIDELGLPAALEWLAADFQKRYHIPTHTALTDPIPQIPPQAATAAFRIAQEALNNVARHAPQSSVSISLTARPDSLSLIISDDGPGFSRPVESADSFGLLSMEEQAAAAGADFVVSSSPGNGTAISVTMPLSLKSSAPHARHISHS
jgi:signal transduction histidine kinase